MTTADVLRATAKAFSNGEIAWGQEWFIKLPEVDDCGARCALGGIAYAVDPGDLDGNPFFIEPGLRVLSVAAAVDLASYLIEELGASRCMTDGEFDVVETVGGWNDEPGRTVEQVVAALEAAAARIDERFSTRQDTAVQDLLGIR